MVNDTQQRGRPCQSIARLSKREYKSSGKEHVRGERCLIQIICIVIRGILRALHQRELNSITQQLQ